MINITNDLYKKIIKKLKNLNIIKLSKSNFLKVLWNYRFCTYFQV